MDRATYLREQYIALRQEIGQCQDRIFKLIAVGLFVLPGGQYLVKTLDAPFFLPYLPLLVIAVALLYLAENNALMRCGRYVRQHIDAEIPGLMTWEEWLESPEASDPRRKDRLVSYSFYIILGAYYIAGVSASWIYLRDTLGREAGFVALGVYSGLALWFGGFLVTNIRSTTSTLLDGKSIKTPLPQTQEAVEKQPRG